MNNVKGFSFKLYSGDKGFYTTLVMAQDLAAAKDFITKLPHIICAKYLEQVE